MTSGHFHSTVSFRVFTLLATSACSKGTAVVKEEAVEACAATDLVLRSKSQRLVGYDRGTSGTSEYLHILNWTVPNWPSDAAGAGPAERLKGGRLRGPPPPPVFRESDSGENLSDAQRHFYTVARSTPVLEPLQ